MSIGSLVGPTFGFLDPASLNPRPKGIPFNDTTNWRLDVVQKGQEILGDRLIGFQAGNEPDLYLPHGHRPEVQPPPTFQLLRKY